MEDVEGEFQGRGEAGEAIGVFLKESGLIRQLGEYRRRIFLTISYTSFNKYSLSVCQI